MSLMDDCRMLLAGRKDSIRLFWALATAHVVYIRSAELLL